MIRKTATTNTLSPIWFVTAAVSPTFFFLSVFLFLFSTSLSLSGNSGRLTWVRHNSRKHEWYPFLLVCAVFSIAQAMMWLPLLRFFDFFYKEFRIDIEVYDTQWHTHRRGQTHGLSVNIPQTFPMANENTVGFPSGKIRIRLSSLSQTVSWHWCVQGLLACCTTCCCRSDSPSVTDIRPTRYCRTPILI